MRSEIMITPLMVYGLFTAILNLAGVVNSEDQLSVISSSASLDKFYVEMKRLHSVRKPEDDSQENLDDICVALLSSVYFFYHHEIRPISLSDEWVKSELENHANPYIQNLSKGQENRCLTLDFLHLDENIQEDVLACGAKKRRSETFQLYLISRKYDFGCMTEADAFYDKNRHTGRFVFVYDDKKIGKGHLIALAENPVTVFKFGLEERKYHERVLLADAVKRNARCNHLTSFEKLRLCSAALNAKAYKGMILFLSREEDVQPDCENVDLFYPYIRSGRTHYDKVQNVSVFKCAAKFVGTGTPADFFISVGDGNHTFFISSREGKRMLIRKYFNSYNLGTLERT